MKNQYKNLMQQQNVAGEATRTFYEKLENAPQKSGKFRWSMVLVAACLCLVIPMTVLALEHIFGLPNVHTGEMPYASRAEGYLAKLENVQSKPLADFSEELQSLREDKVAYFASWEAAEERLGIDLLDNPVLENAAPIGHYLGEGNHCISTYRTLDGRFHTASTVAAFEKDRVMFEVKANVAAEHPGTPADFLALFHGASAAYIKDEGVNVTSEEYTTRAGIPVSVILAEFDYYTDCVAVFAVNGVSYEIRTLGKHTRDTTEKEVLLEVLDGFLLP